MSKLEKAKLESLQKIAKLKHIDDSKKHFLICTGPKCFDTEAGDRVWKKIKAYLKEHNLDQGNVFRTRAKCLRICSEGPIGVVYPEAKWFCQLNEENIEPFLQSYFLEGHTDHPLEFCENKAFQQKTP